MAKILKISLDSTDISQLLDGLHARARTWRQTAEFLDTGYTADDSFVCEDCTASEEAVQIANHYEKIIDQIRDQIASQTSS